MFRSLIFICLVLSSVGCSKVTTSPIGGSLLASEVRWEQLNPARGDKSPKAATLWGDRTGPGPAGFLLKPADGFRSPPHIHNVAYRGVVISGLLHNDDPEAADMWMPKGSFWTQPAGEVHITAAKGADSLAYIEVEDSFGVLPAKKKFDDGERPVNVVASNLVWLSASDVKWIKGCGANTTEGAQMSFLWGDFQDEQPSGVLVRLPSESKGKVVLKGSKLQAVVIQGSLKGLVSGKSDLSILGAGSYFESAGKSAFTLNCEKGEACILYVRSSGPFKLIQK